MSLPVPHRPVSDFQTSYPVGTAQWADGLSGDAGSLRSDVPQFAQPTPDGAPNHRLDPP